MLLQECSAFAERVGSHSKKERRVGSERGLGTAIGYRCVVGEQEQQSNILRKTADKIISRVRSSQKFLEAS